MDAREQLRRYLEQRREFGESDLMLDGLSVDDALRALGAAGTATAGASKRDAALGAAASASGEWRDALKAAGVVPQDGSPRLDPPAAKPAGPAQKPETANAGRPVALAPTGLVVGTASHELFAGPGTAFTSLGDVAEAVRGCTKCGLYATARNPVPGEGSPDADLMCVGEAPGATEDETGRPFVGQAGQLLTKILAAIDLSREQVFICNVLKHRPPGNRNPAPAEVAACSPYLIRQIELIRPKVILALGTFAAQTLLDTKLAIGKLRGQVHRYYGVPLIVTYHPAALLRNPNWKRPTWEDVQLARRILDDARTRG